MPKSSSLAVVSVDADAASHEDVRRLEIAMEDAPLVRRIERAGNLAGHRASHRRQPSDRAARDLHVLEHEIARPDVVELADVRVVQCGDRPRFLLEAAQPIGIGGKRLGEHLDRDVTPQTRVAGTIYLAHPAGAERRDDFKRAELGAGGQRTCRHDSSRGKARRVSVPESFRRRAIRTACCASRSCPRGTRIRTSGSRCRGAAGTRPSTAWSRSSGR